MKTEKRLTMALSVLVALMMLAVPLASSSNLFVDGGQTNSNGDAPSLGAASYRVDFILNEGSEGRISLDEATVAVAELKALNKDGSVNWYLGEDGNIFAVITGEVTIQYLIWALNNTYEDDSSEDKDILSKEGYQLDLWKDGSGSTYTPSSADDPPSEGDKITKNMTLTATWLLNDLAYAEIPVDVVYNDETKEYVKAFPKFKGTYTKETLIDEKNVYVTAAGTFIADGIDKLDTYGIVVNAETGDAIKPIDKVYEFKTTYGEDKEIAKNTTDLKIPVTSKLTVTYTFDEKNFSKIVVSSIAFKDGKDVTLYANKIRSYSYVDVYKALVSDFDGDSNKDKLTFDLPILALAVKEEDSSEATEPVVGEKEPEYIEDLTKDGYKLTGWNNGAELLQSENNASSPLTLDAKLNGYYVLFMSKGQSEYVYVPFGELSADLTKLDVAGVNHWVYVKYDTYAGETLSISENNIFSSFSDSVVRTIDGLVESNYDGKSPIVVFVACFDSRGSTGYAVFDASEKSGNFGNEYVTKMIIPGKVGNTISLPSSNPVYDDEDSRTVFLGWKNGSTPYSSANKYAVDITTYKAAPQSYTYTITFYDGNNVVGIFYYEGVIPTTDITTGLKAFEVDGKVYEATYDSKDKLSLDSDSQKAYDSILTPDKAGYYITQWNDADKNKVIEFKWSSGDYINNTKVEIKDKKDDLKLYAQFEPKEYTIVYVNTYTTGNGMPQYVNVDETVTLFGESTFVYNGYKLVGWNERADGKGVSHGLGSSFTLNGEQYENLEGESLILYAVWEQSGSGSGDNNEGNNDSNTDTYLLAGILIVIIVLIIVVAVVLRKKQ